MQHVLVAGATGYLGGFVARELKARGDFVRALARSPEKLDPVPLDEIAEAEVTRPASLGHVCDGIDVVFSSIGITRQKDGLSFRDVRLCNRHQGELLAFFTTVASTDMMAPAAGTHTLEAHYRSLGAAR